MLTKNLSMHSSYNDQKCITKVIPLAPGHTANICKKNFQHSRETSPLNQWTLANEKRIFAQYSHTSGMMCTVLTKTSSHVINSTMDAVTNLPVTSELSCRHCVWSFLHLTRPDASFTPAPADDTDDVDESASTAAAAASLHTLSTLSLSTWPHFSQPR